jgi:hypothetical protein
MNSARVPSYRRYPAAASHGLTVSYGDERIDFRSIPGSRHRIQVHARERAHDLQVIEFLGSDVHQ